VIARLTVKVVSGTEKSEGNDRDTVMTPIGMRAGGDDSEIGDPASLLLCKPVQVADGFVVDGGRELNLDAHGATVVAFDDEIDFVFVAISA